MPPAALIHGGLTPSDRILAYALWPRDRLIARAATRSVTIQNVTTTPPDDPDLSHLYVKTNVYAMVLQFIDTSAEYELGPVLQPLESAILAIDNRISDLAKLDDDEAQLVIDDECAYVDDLLGAAFVMAQRYLTVVTSSMVRLSKHAKTEKGATWPLPTEKFPMLENYGPASPGDASVRFAVAVNAASNFFKHESEWPHPWSSLPWREAQTFNAVRGFGVVETSSGNLRSIAKGLGVTEYRRLQPLTDGLDQWRTDLLGAFRSELSNLGLL